MVLKPHIGAIVHVVFPAKRICPAIVTAHTGREKNETGINCVVFDTEVIQLVSVKHDVPHETVANGEEICWR